MDYFQATFEIEDNDTCLEANGALRSDVTYFGYPDDSRDYFAFYLWATGTITVELDGHTSQGVQLQLLRRNPDGSCSLVECDCDLVPPFEVVAEGSPGPYRVYIYSVSGFNTTYPYTLRVEYPLPPGNDLACSP